MAAAIDTVSTTLEGQLWEVALRLQAAEAAVDPATRPNNVTTTVDTENQTIAVTFSTAATFTISAAGAMVATPTPYLA